jgi:hypothetical protein
MATETPDLAAPAAEQKPVDQPAPPAALVKVPVRMGLAPTTIEEGWRLAQMFAQSEMVPKQYRSKPADVLVAIQYGLEVGFAPMQALQSIAVINGRASVWGDGFLALLMSSPVYQDHDEYYEVGGERRDALTADDMKADSTVAVCTFWRRGKRLPTTRRFSVGQAKKAQLWGKEGPWQTYPDRQLAMRARGFAGRDAFPDVLRGVKTAEEARDIPAGEDDVIDSTPIVQPRRASDAAVTVPRESPDNPASSRRRGSAGNFEEMNGEVLGAPVPGIQQNTRAGLLVIRTAFVRPQVGEPYYEITTQGPKGEADKPVYLTRDESVYKEAASFEGTEHRIIASFHTQPKGGADTIDYVLDAIDLFEG